MVIADAVTRYAGQVVRPVLCALVVAYIAYHAVQGDRGLLAYLTYSQEHSRALATLEEVQHDRDLAFVEPRVDVARRDRIKQFEKRACPVDRRPSDEKCGDDRDDHEHRPADQPSDLGGGRAGVQVTSSPPQGRRPRPRLLPPR